MKYAFTAAALFVLVSAQDLSSIPACAAPCLQSAVSSSTSCSMTDYKCICNDMDAIQGAGSSCVMDKCGAQVAMCMQPPHTLSPRSEHPPSTFIEYVYVPLRSLTRAPFPPSQPPSSPPSRASAPRPSPPPARLRPRKPQRRPRPRSRKPQPARPVPRRSSRPRPRPRSRPANAPSRPS